MTACPWFLCAVTEEATSKEATAARNEGLEANWGVLREAVILQLQYSFKARLTCTVQGDQPTYLAFPLSGPVVEILWVSVVRPRSQAHLNLTSRVESTQGKPESSALSLLFEPFMCPLIRHGLAILTELYCSAPRECQGGLDRICPPFCPEPVRASSSSRGDGFLTITVASTWE